MKANLERHAQEVERNRLVWERKPLLRHIYDHFYERIVRQMDGSLDGAVIEVGSGIGNLKSRLPRAVATDLFPNSWLDLVCDGYELPFRSGCVSHLVLFDVFHHLEVPRAFLSEALRVLRPRGRLILFEPYVSAASFPVYALLHPEPLGLGSQIDLRDQAPAKRNYYAAQGNATRLFFRNEPPHSVLSGWRILRREAFSAFAYLLSGGYSRPAFYPLTCAGLLRSLDDRLSRFPRLFGARCLVVLQKIESDREKPGPPSPTQSNHSTI